MEAETPHMHTPEERVAKKFLSSSNFFEIRKANIHTTGKERKTAVKMVWAFVKKVVSTILAPRSTIAVLINSSPLADRFSHEGIFIKFVITIPATNAIIYSTFALPMTFTMGEYR